MSTAVSPTKFYRDPVTGALLNTDNHAYNKILEQRASANKNRQVDMRLGEIENDLSEIKRLLKLLIGNKNV